MASAQLLTSSVCPLCDQLLDKNSTTFVNHITNCGSKTVSRPSDDIENLLFVLPISLCKICLRNFRMFESENDEKLMILQLCNRCGLENRRLPPLLTKYGRQ